MMGQEGGEQSRGWAGTVLGGDVERKAAKRVQA